MGPPHFRGQLCSYFNLGLTNPTPNYNRQPTAPVELGEAVATLVCKVQLMKTSQASCAAESLGPGIGWSLNPSTAWNAALPMGFSTGWGSPSWSQTHKEVTRTLDVYMWFACLCAIVLECVYIDMLVCVCPCIGVHQNLWLPYSDDSFKVIRGLSNCW